MKALLCLVIFGSSLAIMYEPDMSYKSNSYNSRFGVDYLRRIDVQLV